MKSTGKLYSMHVGSAFEAGARDARFGIYDKWYRYNHSDEGAAYDAGWRSVPDKEKTWEQLTILEGLPA